MVAPLGMGHQQVSGRPNESAALSAVDRLRRADEAFSAASANLHDDQGGSVEADEIELTEPTAIASLQHSKPASLQVSTRSILPDAPRPLRGRRARRII